VTPDSGAADWSAQALERRLAGSATREYRSKSDLVAETVRELIADGTFPPGAHLRQRELAALFELSPTPVREGLRRLESEGLVRFDVHRGATVTAPPMERLEEHLRILVVLEAFAGELAAAKMTVERLQELRTLAAAHASCQEGDPRIRDLNRRFHFCIYESAGSPMLLTLLSFLWRSFPMGPQFWRPHPDSVAEHALLVQALESGDAERVRTVLHDHVVGSLEPIRTDTPTASTETTATTLSAHEPG
jgi:DNA-binding GntR family transcriptional regulator